MKAKKWYKISIVSLVLIVAEVVCFILIGLPAIKTNNVFKALEKGKAKQARNIYKDLSSGTKKKVRTKLKDFGTYEVNQYSAGKIEYEDITVMFEAASDMDSKCEDVMSEYRAKAASVELESIYEKGVAEYIDNNSGVTYDYSDEYYDYMSEFSDAYYDLNSDAQVIVDQDLQVILESKYNEYEDGNLTVDEIDAYVSTATTYFSYGTDPYEYASDLDEELYLVKEYRSSLDEAQTYYDDEDYFGCIDYCDNELEWTFADGDNGTGYKEKFQDLRDDAYEEGKTYYVTKAEDLINSGEVESGKEILNQVDELYGDEVDTSEAWELTRDAWMTPYVDYLNNWEENLKKDIASGVVIGSYDDASKLTYDDYVPYNVFLYDFDGNGTPEMLLRADDYTYYSFTYDGSNVKYTGAFRLISIIDNGAISEPISMPDGYIEGYEQLEFANNAWSVVKYYISDGTNFEVNGSAASAEDAKAIYDEFYDMQTEVHVENASLDDAEAYSDYIYDYPEDGYAY